MVPSSFGGDCWEIFAASDVTASRGRRCRGQKKTDKTTLLSECGSVFKKSLTGPSLLEMSDYRCELNRSMQHPLNR